MMKIKKSYVKIFTLAIVFIMIASMSISCTKLATAPTITTPLVVATDKLSLKFSPFFAETAYDMDIVGMTQLSLLTTDRVGGIIYNSIRGETVSYNGTPYKYTGISDIKVNQEDDKTTYKITLKKGVKFSDGTEMTADDIIFNYYVYLDPSYVGATTLSSYKIIGLKNYLTQTSDEVYKKYEQYTTDIFKAGADHKWSANDSWTEAVQTSYWNTLKEVWMEDIQAIIDHCLENYLEDYAALLDKTPDEIKDNEGLRVAFGMLTWGYGDLDESGNFVTAVNGKSYDLKSSYPTLEDYYNECYTSYGGDPVLYWDTEKADETDVLGTANLRFISEYGSKDESMSADGIPNIEGIKKTGQYTVEVTTEGFEASAIYSICGIQIAPLHYYGETDKYDYKNNKFGHDYGDLSNVALKTSAPMGAGPYKFIEYKNEVVYYEANENYYKGCPKIAFLQYKEMLEADKITAIESGDADISNPSGSKSKFDEIRKINNGDITGNIITTNAVDNLGYGYIGLNSDTVRVGSNSSSTESKNLRKGLATVISVYRDVAINSFYGDAASVINYPISNTSWAAPQKSDPDYKVAFSVDVDGKDIYTDTMSAEDKYAAALTAAIGYLKSAGFTYDEASKKFTAAPEGTKLSYEILIPGDGKGDHPSFQVISNASAAFKNIGITLEINDLSDSGLLWERLDAGTQELWVAAWGATIDPDMYQVYHSSGISDSGSGSNHYHINDATLDKLIVDARMNSDQDYRKSTYKSCLDIIIDWACEIPIYQRQNIIIFSSERIVIDTITPDITTYWGWANDIELLEVNEIAK